MAAVVDDVYVLSGATSGREVAQAIATYAVSADVAIAPDGDAYIVVEPGVQITMYDDPDETGVYIAEVYHHGSREERRALATRVYAALVDHTRWSLRHETDDDPGDGVLAERIVRAA